MKKIFLLMLVLLISSCMPTLHPTRTLTSAPPITPSVTKADYPLPSTKEKRPTLSIREKYPPLLEAFESTKVCPNICWLGIHPGTTTSEQAMQIINVQSVAQDSEFAIQTYWFPEETKTFSAHVTIIFSNNLVKSITLSRLAPFTVGDFIGLLGQPSEISLIVHKGLHNDQFTMYNLYYLSLKTTFQVSSGGEHGPDPNDFIELMEINIEIQDDYRQPWLGYGHYEEYALLARPTPTTLVGP